MKQTFQRVMVAGLILLQGAAFAIMTGTYVFPAVVGLLVLLGLTGWFRTSLSRPKELIASLVLALPFVTLYRLFPDYSPDITGLVDVHLSYVAGQYFLLLQAVNLFLERENSLPPWLVLYGAFTLVCAGNVYARAGQYLVYRILSLGFALLTAVFLASMLRPNKTQRSSGGWLKYGLMSGLLGVCLLLTVVAGHVVERNRSRLDRLFMALMRRNPDTSTTGFSRWSRLGSVVRMKNDGSARTALRIFADRRPGYLRGQAYSHFERSGWETVARSRKLTAGSEPADPAEHNLFIFGDGDPDSWQRAEIWPDPGITEGMFVPPATVALRAPVETIEVDENAIVSSDGLVRGVPYTACFLDHRRDHNWGGQAPGPGYRRVDQADARIVQLAERIFAGRTTVAGKIAAVTDYFQRHYDYALDIQIPSGRDPLTYFLLERPAAHCEYFASGAAVLLRLGGVPSRYVGGFVATEKNAVGGYWIARHRDAHAWAEAYVPGSGWTIVEATPPAGIPQSGKASKFSELWDYLRHRMHELVVAIRLRGLRGAGEWFWERVNGALALVLSISHTALAIKGLLAAALVSYLIYRWTPRSGGQGADDPQIVRMQRLLGQMDRRLENEGLVRSSAETLHQFAERLEAEGAEDFPSEKTARWYIRYARLRYGEPITTSAVEELAGSMPET